MPRRLRRSARRCPAISCYAQLNRDPFGERYVAQGADGSQRQVRFLTSEGGGADTDPRLLARLTSLRRAALPRLEVKAIANGRVVLISDAVEETLQDRYEECRVEGLPGIRARNYCTISNWQLPPSTRSSAANYCSISA